MRHGFLLALPIVLSGCAHYYWPASQLETPETISPERFGRLELLGLQSGSDLIATPSKQATDPKTGVTPDPVLQLSPVNWTLGVGFALSPKFEVGIRVPPYAPILARAKYQFYGQPEGQSGSGDFSVAACGQGGLLLANSTVAGGGMSSFYQLNGSVIGGIRFAKNHLASLAPFFSLAGLSGAGTASGSGVRFGASLGYQWDPEALIARAELTWATGSYSQNGTSTQAGGFFPGLLLGLKF